jgi:nitroreductase
LVVAVVSRADPNARKPEWEQVLTVGAVCMNLTTAASALGYASVWLTGWAAYNADALAALGVGTEEKLAGCIHRKLIDYQAARWGICQAVRRRVYSKYKVSIQAYP